MKDTKWNNKPAIVRYIGKSDNNFTYRQLNKAIIQYCFFITQIIFTTNVLTKNIYNMTSYLR